MKLNLKKCVFEVWLGKLLKIMIRNRKIEADSDKI